MKSLRRWYWIASTFFRKYAYGIVIGLISSILLMANISKIVNALPIKETHYIGRVGVYNLEELPLDIQNNISYGLTKIDANGEVSLDAAQTISVDDEGKRYTVTLNPDLYFSDGSRLTTHDLNINVTDVETEILSDEVIVYKLRESFAPFPAVLSQPIFKRVYETGFKGSTVVVGLRPLKLTSTNESGNILTQIILEDEQEKYIYRIYPTEADAITAFKLGHIDRIEHLTNSALTDWPNVQVTTEATNNRYLSLFFNTTNPELQDKSIRQMLAYATPKPTDDSRIISPIAKNSWVYNPQVKTYETNTDSAQAIYDRLKQANPNLNLNFELTTTPAYQETAHEIAAAWNNLGINTNVRVVAFPDTNDYQILLIGQQIPADPDQYTLWHSTQATNITRYQNAKIDKLLEDGRKENDKDLRKLIYQDFQRFLVEDSPVVFLKALPTYTIERS